MNALADLPAWVQLTVAALVLVGSTFTLVGGIGLLRLPTFYDRAHAPTIGSSGGIACLAAASIILFTVMDGRVVVKTWLLFVFITITMPVTLILLARAVLFRDRAEGNPDVPPPE